MAYDNNKFCWHGVISTDPEKAKAFYEAVLGWTSMTVPMGDSEATLLCAKDGVPRAHLSAPEMDGIPSHWDNYLRVEDVDASTQAAVENGGAVVLPPMDIPVGRMSFVSAPSGAVLSLFHEADAGAENAGDGHGSIHWTELMTTDVDSDLAWVKATFGFNVDEMPMPKGTYYLLKNGEAMCGGLMASPQEGIPSMWMTWVEVDDVDEVAGRVSANGGQVYSEIMEMEGVGRLVPVGDPTGGAFGIITPAQ